MAAESAMTSKRIAKEIKPDKLDRIKNLKWELAAVEKRDISDIGLIDEALEAGLSSIEARVAKLKKQASEVDQVPNV